MVDFYRGQKVIVTGGWGLLGTHLVEALVAAGARVRVASRRPTAPPHPRAAEVEHVSVDLTDRAACRRVMAGMDAAFHLAAVGWGFHENLRRQPELLTENVLLGATVVDSAFQAGVARLLVTSSIAVYPAHDTEQDEATSCEAPPHAGEAGYAEAKRLIERQARAYHAQHGWPVAIVRPANPYGPWDDTDPARAHVIPALIRRALAGESPFLVYGTGRPLRSFIHARDVARGMLRALERRADADPINLASPTAVSIGDLVDKVLAATGHRAELRFDTSRPDGPARRLPSARRAAERLGLTDLIDLDAGLRETVAWFREQGART